MQGRSVLYANTHLCTWEIGKIFLKGFLSVVHVLRRFFPVCLSVIQHRLLIHVKPTVWVVECDKFETFLNKFCLQAISQYIAYSWKSEHENRPWLIIFPFKIYLKRFSIQMLFHFFQVSLSLSPWKSKKSIKDYFDVLNWNVMDQTMTTIIHVSRCTFDAVSTRILQEIYS